MQTMNLQIEDSFFPQFKSLIESFIRERKVQIVEDGYDYQNNYPQSVVVSSVEEVRRRVYEAEQEEGMSEEEYDFLMDKFFREELRIER